MQDEPLQVVRSVAVKSIMCNQHKHEQVLLSSPLLSSPLLSSPFLSSPLLSSPLLSSPLLSSLLLSSQGKVRPQAETDCVQHLSNQLRRHRRHRRVTNSQQHRAALRRIRQLQQTVGYLLCLIHRLYVWFDKKNPKGQLVKLRTYISVIFVGTIVNSVMTMPSQAIG